MQKLNDFHGFILSNKMTGLFPVNLITVYKKEVESIMAFVKKIFICCSKKKNWFLVCCISYELH